MIDDELLARSGPNVERLHDKCDPPDVCVLETLLAQALSPYVMAAPQVGELGVLVQHSRQHLADACIVRMPSVVEPEAGDGIGGDVGQST